MSSIDSIHTRIRRAREAAGLSQRELGDLCGVSQSAVNLWESEGGNVPRPKRLQLIANQLKVSVEALTFGNGANVIDRKQEGGRNAFIARYYSRFKGDQPVRHHHEVPSADDDDDLYAYRRDWLQRHGLVPENLRVFVAEDDSMAMGEQMLVDITSRAIASGKPYLLDGPGGLRVRRVYVCHDGQLNLRADRAAYPEETVAPDSLEVVGQVVAFTGVTA